MTRTASRWPVVAAVAVASFLVRAATLRRFLAGDPLLRVPILDDAAYLEMARAMASGEARAWFLAPLHPWLVATVSSAPTMSLACWMNALFGVATSALVAFATCDLHSRRAGLVAGLLHALAGAFVFSDVLPGQEPVLTLLHVAAFVAAIRLAREPRPGTAALLGVLTGVAMMGRATSIPLALLVVPAMAQRHAGKRLRAVAACAAGLLVVLLPAAFRNASVAGAFTPLPWGGGPNLYAANGPDSRASVSLWASELGGDPAQMAQSARAVASAAEHRDLAPYEVSSWWTSRAWAECGTPGETSLHLARKAALFWSAEEAAGNHSADAEREFAGWTASVPVSAWWLLAAGAAAWWLVRDRRPELDGVALVTAGTCVLLAIVFPVTRYRIPCAALAAVAIGVAAADVAARLCTARRIAQSAAVFVALTLVAHLPLRGAPTAAAHLNVAWAHLQAGDDRALVVERLRRAIAVEPESGAAHAMLANVLVESGDAAGALAALDAAKRDARTRWQAEVTSLPILVLAGRTPAARATATRLLAERRDDVELVANAALVAGAAGERAEAVRLLAEARRLDADHPAVQRAAASLGGAAPPR